MNALLSKTANLSMLALAALPIVSLGFARAEPASVKLSDLNLSRPADVRTFHGRVGHAANKVCLSGAEARDLARLEACRTAVRAEAMDKASHAQIDALIASRAVG